MKEATDLDGGSQRKHSGGAWVTVTRLWNKDFRH